ncbi:MAG: transporter [Haloarculaceae archaeon]
MSVATTVSYVIHLLFAGLWAGSVLFVAYAVLPMARAGEVNAGPLATVAGKLRTVSRTSAVLLLLTGAHLAAATYSVADLTGSTVGYLVVAMIVLWLVMMGLVEAGAGKLTDGANEKKVREPAKAATPLLQAAAVVALLLLVDAGLLAGGI